jgi:hypothetical protein
MNHLGLTACVKEINQASEKTARQVSRCTVCIPARIKQGRRQMMIAKDARLLHHFLFIIRMEPGFNIISYFFSESRPSIKLYEQRQDKRKQQ